MNAPTVLALNFGTATLKYGLFGPEMSAPILSGTIPEPADVARGIAEVRQALRDQPLPRAIVHRVVHGGPRHGAPLLIDGDVEAELQRLVPLAPLHNRIALEAIAAARDTWPSVPQVAVFDTAFHAGMPARATRYAVPAAWEQAGLRRYGFHGLSHQHAMEAAAAHLDRSPGELRIVSCHLGSGASVCAIERGRSVDTSMGLTPLEGLVMSTRCGDLDPGASGFVARALGLTQEAIEQCLYQDSGLKGWAGEGGDLRRIEEAARAGDTGCLFALDAYAYRIRKYIGAYAAAMGGCDAITFAGGVGENSPGVRGRALAGLDFLGVTLDEHVNEAPAFDAAGIAGINASGERVAVLVVHAREEWLVARQARELLESDKART